MQKQEIDGLANDPVLVVEDNSLNQKVAVLLLGKLGMSAQMACNGFEALDAVKRNHFSIILMDCHMPEMDGFEATSAIRKYEAASGTYTPIIAVTALTTPRDRQRCLESGMDDYIAKPIEKDILKSKIDHWLLTSLALHNPGSAALFRNSIVANEQVMPEEDQVNFGELKEFYGEHQLSQMLQSFMLDTAQKLGRLESFIKEENVSAVSILALELKAQCAGIGARQLAKLCLYQQMAAGSGDWVEAQETFTSLQRAFAQGKHLFQSGVLTEENSPIDEFELGYTHDTLKNTGDSPGHTPHK